MASSGDLWSGLGPALAILVGLVTLAMSRVQFRLFLNNMKAYFSRNKHITIPEYSAKHFGRNELFVAIEAYLSEFYAHQALDLKADLGLEEQKPQVSIDDEQEITDTYKGTKLRWYADKVSLGPNLILHEPGDVRSRYYRVSFPRTFLNEAITSYLPHVLEEGRAIIVKNRHRCLFTNIRREGEIFWKQVAFQHPATFGKLAMDPKKKEDIIDDLKAFRAGKDYYAQAGKAWKRGYLLFGPPGTGKSMMIAAISDLLKYDIYDLELTAVKNNTELRELFVETKGKSIIVIEDIDRSVDIIGKRRDKKSGGESNNMTTSPPKKGEMDDDGTKLTLSGLLNFIDGIWSACGGERIIILTTNNVDKLDEALIRPGRIDKPIEMSFCRYEAFKVLAKNYLDITVPELSEHQLFELFVEIRQLLGEVDMSPAEVAGYLTRTEKMDADACLKRLLGALKNAKGNAARDEAKENEEAVEIVRGVVEKLEEAEAK